MWVELLGHSGYICFALINNAIFPKWLCQFTLLLVVYGSSVCSASLLIPDLFIPFNFSHSGRCVVVSHCFHVFSLMSNDVVFICLLLAIWLFFSKSLINLDPLTQKCLTHTSMTILVLPPEVLLLNSPPTYPAGSLISLTGWPTCSSKTTSQIEIFFFFLHISTIFFRFFSHIGHYRVLSRIPCAYQLSILYIVVCICQSQSPNLSLPPIPW